MPKTKPKALKPILFDGPPVGHCCPNLLPRKEVIQPHLQVRLPCYDFTPVADPTFADRLPYERGWLRLLRVLPTPVV